MASTQDETIAELQRANVELRRQLSERDVALAQRDSDYDERIAHQAATVDVLKAMSASPGDALPALETIAHRARALCGALGAVVYRVDGAMMDQVVYHRPDLPAEQLRELRGRFPRPVAGATMAPAVTERRILHIRDMDAWPGASEGARRFSKSALWVPLLRDDTVIGLIGIDNLEIGGFSDTQIELLKTFAEQAVIAITSAETYLALQTRTADLQESLEYQTATSDLLKVISRSTFDLQPVLDTVIERAVQLCEAELGILSMRDGDVYRVRAVSGDSPDLPAVWLGKATPIYRETLTGRVALEGRSIHVPNMAADLDYNNPHADAVEKSRIGTGLGMPLLRNGAVVGVIALVRHRVEPFTERQIDLVSTFADQAVIAIENTRLITEQREALEQQTATAEVLGVINASPGNLAPVFDAMLERALRLCGAAFGALHTFGGARFKIVAAKGVPPAYEAHRRRHQMPAGPDTPPGEAAITGRPVQVVDVMTHPYFVARPDRQDPLINLGGIRAVLNMPLLKDGATVGMFVIYRKEPGVFPDKQIALLENFAAQAVIAMENARLLGELRESLEHETATAEVLGVINASPGNLTPVFDAILDKAHTICGAEMGTLFEWDGTHCRALATVGYSDDIAAMARQPLVAAGPMLQLIAGERYHHTTFNQIPDENEPHAWGVGFLKRSGIRTNLVVPLRKDAELIGFISANRHEVRPFSDKEIALLENFAAQAVIAMDNARLLGELRDRTSELAERNAAFSERIDHQAATIDVLKEMSASPADAQPVFDLICDQARALLGTPAVTLFEYDGTLVHLRARSLSASFADPAALTAYTVGWPRILDRGSLSCRAILDRTVIHVRDMDAEPGVSPEVRALGSKTQVVIPLMRDGRAIGAISTGSTRPDGVSDTQIELLKTFAEQAVIAIGSAETWRALQERTAELALRNSEYGERIEHQAATIDVLKAMSASPGDPQPVFDLICGQARDLLSVENAVLFSYQDGLLDIRADVGTPEMVGHSAYEAYRRMLPMTPARGSITGRAVLDHQVVHIRDLTEDTEVSDVVRNLGHRSQLAVPLMRDGHAIGGLTVAMMRPGGFSDTQVALLETFAEQAVIATTSADTYRALQERTAELAQRNSEFGERIEQQAATIDVLKIMSSTPDDTKPVFDQIIRRAKELCNSSSAGMFEYRDGLVHYSGIHTDVDMNTPSFSAYVAQFPMVPTRDSMSCRVILDNQLLHIRDMEQQTDLSPATRALVKDGLYRSFLAVPLSRDGKAIGCIWLSAPQSGGYTDSQIALLQTFAEQAVIAIGSVATFRALRERTAELAQRQSELRVTFENMGDGVAMFDGTPRLVAWNAKFQEIFAVPEELLEEHRTYADYIRYLGARGDYGPNVDVEEQIRGVSETAGEYHAYERIRPDGRVIEIRHNPVAGGGFVLIFSDVTERKRNEAEIAAARDAAQEATRTIEAAFRELKTAQANLIQAEKMASLGQLTAGIAHEIKNPLNFVNNFAELSVDLLGELKDAIAPAEAALNEDQRDEVDEVVTTLTSNLQKISEHGKRADGIVKAMLEHSRGASAERRTVDINALADEALNLAYHGARAQDQSFNITLERDFGVGIAPIEVNPQDMTRVLLNLFSNGFYAANKRARSGAKTGFNPTLRVTTRDACDTVEIRVRDNGIGIPPDIRDKLFQPFFTTKPTGEGTGLGLSITYDIVTKAHGGTISIDSEVNEFTEFVVTLPRGMFAGEGSRT